LSSRLSQRLNPYRPCTRPVSIARLSQRVRVTFAIAS
jgi:hypothetical protein